KGTRLVRHAERVGPYMRFAVVLVYPLVGLLFRRRWIGLERIPATGPAIVAVNHISYADPLIFARFVWDAGRVPRYLAKASLFRPLPRKRITIAAGPPVDLSDFAGSAPTSAVLHEMTDRIMLEIRDLVAGIRGEAPPAEFYRRPAAREGRS